MKEKRVDVLLSVASFLHLMFLGFAGSLAAEVIKSQQSDLILFLSSFFTLILAFILAYIYSQLFFLTKH